MLNSSRPLRFIVAGVSGLVLLFVLTYVLASAGVAPFFASSSAYAICFITIYLVHRYWTFSSDVPHGQALPRYLVVQLACALLSGFIAYGLVALLGLKPFVMSVLTALAASAISYFATSMWVFAKR